MQGIDRTVRRNAFGRQADSFETDLELAGPQVEVLGTDPASGRIVMQITVELALELPGR